MNPLLHHPKITPVLYASYTGIVLYFAPIQWQGFSSFAFSTPLIVLLAAWIAHQINTDIAKDISALVFLLPVVGFIAWKRQILELDLNYYPKDTAILDVFWTARIVSADSTIMFLSIMPPLSFLAKNFKPFGMTILGALALSLVCIHLSYVNLLRGNIFISSLLIWGAELHRLVPLVMGALIYKKTCFELKMKIMLSIFVLLSSWLITPPITNSLLQLPTSRSASDAPEGMEGLGYSQASIDPFSPRFIEELDAQDTQVLQSQWWCSDTPKQYHLARAIVALKISKHVQIIEIKEQIRELSSRGITQIGIVGQHRDSKTLPPLKRHSENPTITWFIDPPPKTSRKGHLENQKIVWNNLRFHMACQIWVPWETTIDTLYHLGEELKTKCSSLYLILSEPKEIWVPPTPCTQKTAQ